VQFVAVAAGAVLGANLRYVLGIWAAEHWGNDFPYGTLLINVSGSFVIGLFLSLMRGRLDIDPLWQLFFATGLLGGYTTFSAYAWEALTLANSGALLRAGVYVLASNVVGLFGVWLGSVVGRGFS
jgi:CrcB protein